MDKRRETGEFPAFLIIFAAVLFLFATLAMALILLLFDNFDFSAYTIPKFYQAASSLMVQQIQLGHETFHKYLTWKNTAIFGIIMIALIIGIFREQLIDLLKTRTGLSYVPSQDRKLIQVRERKKQEHQEVQETLQKEAQAQVEEGEEEAQEGRLLQQIDLGHNTLVRFFEARGRRPYLERYRVDRVSMWSNAPFEDMQVSSSEDDGAGMVVFWPVKGSVTNVFVR